MGGLEKIAKGLSDTSIAIRHYSDMEIECSSKLYEEMKLVSLESIASESDSNSDDNLKLLKTVQGRISDLGKVYESLVHCIRGILSSHYTITNSVANEKTLSLLSSKEFFLPENLDGQPSPIIAQVLISSIRGLLHSCPKQTWALHSTLERIFVDTSKTSVHWSPISTTDPNFTWPSLKGFYDTQNKSLYEILERRNFNAVHKSFHTLITGDIDDRGGGANTRGGKDDAVSTIAWWIRFHTRSGFKDRQKIKDIFNHSFGPMGDADIQNTIDKLRKLIPTVRRLGIKLSYESVVTQSVNVLQSRHPSFISSLEEFKRVPNERFEEDAIDMIDAFLSRVERIIQTIHHTVPRTKTVDVEYAHAIFDSGCKHLDPNPRSLPTTSGQEPIFSIFRAEEFIPNNTRSNRVEARHPTKTVRPNQRGNRSNHDLLCAGKGCGKKVEKFILERLGLDKPLPHTLCRECYLKVQRLGFVHNRKGGEKAQPIRARDPHIQRAFALLNMKTTSNPSRSHKSMAQTATHREHANIASTTKDPIETSNPTSTLNKRDPPLDNKQSAIQEEPNPFGNQHFEEGIGSSFNNAACTASSHFCNSEVGGSIEYDATYCSNPHNQQHQAHATTSNVMSLGVDETNEHFEQHISQPTPLSIQIRAALEEGIDELHEGIEEMGRAGWERIKDGSTLTIDEIHESIDAHIREGWEHSPQIPIDIANVAVGPTSISTLVEVEDIEESQHSNTRDPSKEIAKPIDETSAHRKTNPRRKNPHPSRTSILNTNDGQHDQHERKVVPIVEPNEMHSGYHVTETNGYKHTIKLNKCQHTKCIRYCDNFSWAKYCDLCANQENLKEFTPTQCEDCDTSRAPPEPRDHHETMTQDIDSPTQRRERMIQALIDESTEANEGGTPNNTPTNDRASRGDIPHETRRLTWCEGQLWEGECIHMTHEPEPITNEGGYIVGRLRWNHDGSQTRIDYDKCDHDSCNRYFDPIRGYHICEECHRNVVMKGELANDDKSCSSCLGQITPLECGKVPPTMKDHSDKTPSPQVHDTDDKHRAMIAEMRGISIGKTAKAIPRKPTSQRDDEFILNEWEWDENPMTTLNSPTWGDIARQHGMLDNEPSNPESPTWSELIRRDNELDEDIDRQHGILGNEPSSPESPTWSELIRRDNELDGDWTGESNDEWSYEEDDDGTHHDPEVDKCFAFKDNGGDEDAPLVIATIVEPDHHDTPNDDEIYSRKWFAKCKTIGCPCTASYNGQDNEACSKRCKLHQACTHNVHYYPRQEPNQSDPRQPLPRDESYSTKRKISDRQQQHTPRQTPKSYRHSYCGTRGEPRV